MIFCKSAIFLNFCFQNKHMKKYILSVAVVLFFLSACNFMGGKRVEGSGNVTTQDRSVSGFSGIKSSGFFDVYLSSGSAQTVRVEAEDNLHAYIETTVDGNELKVDTKEGYRLAPNKSVKIYIVSPNFSRVHLSGSGDIVSQNRISGNDKIDLSVSGSGNIKVDLNAPNVEAEMSGSGDINLSGEAKKFEGKLSGSGNIHAMDLKTEETGIRISGSGNADVYASSKLDVRVTGSGDVRYKGGVQQVTSNITGSGSVKKVE
jgi:Putative auto-transporter adhesin, head GIN domain